MSAALPAPDCTVAPPAEVAWLVRAIGQRAALALVEARGGTRVLVPATEDGCKQSYLAEIIGRAEVAALARSHAGELVTIPLVRSWRAAIYLAAGGMSQSEIALKVGMSESAVQKLARAGYQPMSNAHCGAQRKSKSALDQPLLPF